MTQASRKQQGRDIKASPAIRDKYQRKLLELVDEMHHSLTYWLLAEYKRQIPRVDALIATDASPARDLLATLRTQLRRWQDRYDERAKAYADWFARRAMTAASAASKSSLSELAGFSVGMHLTRNVNNVLQSIIAENVALIRSIPQKYGLEIEGLVMRSVREGRDIAGLTDDLQKRYGITRRRALDIARDQNNKASASIARARMQDAGITLAVWRHSGRSKHPRKSHQAANGLVFDLAEGLWMPSEDRHIFPGEDINCGCSAAPYTERMAKRSSDALRAWKAKGGKL